VSFRDYTRLEDVLKKFALTPVDRPGLFAACPEVEPSEA
jgi:hypothetical protein